MDPQKLPETDVGVDGATASVSSEAVSLRRVDVLLAQYSAAISLIEHEDQQNYTKLRNYLYWMLGLIAVFGWTIGKSEEPGDATWYVGASVVALVAVASSALFAEELRSGLQCLRDHRDFLTNVELVLIEPTTTLTALTVKPKRRLLNWLPLLLSAVWSVAFMFTFALSLHASGLVP